MGKWIQLFEQAINAPPLTLCLTLAAIISGGTTIVMVKLISYFSKRTTGESIPQINYFISSKPSPDFSRENSSLDMVNRVTSAIEKEVNNDRQE